MDEMRMKQRQEPEVFYYDYATPLGMLRIEENGRGLTAVSPVKPECASCHTGAESLSGNGNGADIARCRMDETPLIRRAAAQLQEYFAGKRKVFDLPLAPEGTPFQHRVWAVLRSIPYGQTLTYGEVASRAGNPKASRAVGMANNRNPLMIIVPCHRVIGAGGKLVGYACGLDKKEFLLNLERGHSELSGRLL